MKMTFNTHNLILCDTREDGNHTKLEKNWPISEIKINANQ